MNWKHWPYWLKGGVIGGGITIISIIIVYSCGLFDSDYFCLVPLFFSPMYLVVALLDNLESFFNITISFEIWMLISVVIWFAIGSFIGSLVGFIKSKKSTQ
ncbi:MAG: hypothetical protein Q7R65_01735 [bacterium]|nr:hypothetical protein [bacterium]